MESRNQQARSQPLDDMETFVINAFIWWAGALVWLAIFATITVVLAGVTLWFCNRMAKGLMEFVRYATARYWVARMEKEGLTFPQTEYRRMVAESKPNSVRDFLNLDGEEEKRLQAQKDHP